MSATGKKIQHIRTITEFHRLRGLPKPLHPLVSLVDYRQVKHNPENNRVSWVQEFYTIGLKRNVPAKFRYGSRNTILTKG